MERMTENFSGAPVLVTGATGFTGARLVRRLAEAGVSVRAIARPTSNREPLRDLPIEWRLGDVFDEETVVPAMQGVGWVFHLATLYRSPEAREEDHRRVHVQSTRILAREALKQPGFRRFVQVSTIGVHGHVEDPPADEQAPFRPDDEYQRTKAEAETWLRDYAAESGLPYAIVRPCAIMGPEDRRLLKIFRMARRRWCPILGRRPCLYHLIHVDDLVELLLRCAVDPRAEGQAFIAGNDEPIALDRMIREIARALGRPVRIVKLPAAPFWMLACLCEAVCPRLGLSPPLYRRRIKFFLNDRAFDTGKARKLLDFACRYDNITGLAETARGYRAAGLL